MQMLEIKRLETRLTQFGLVVIEVINEMSNNILDERDGTVTLPVSSKEEFALSFCPLHSVLLLKIFNGNY